MDRIRQVRLSSVVLPLRQAISDAKVLTGRQRPMTELAPHFAMEIHLHLAAAYPREPWVEHFDWLNPLFNERLETVDGRMLVPDRPGLGFTTSEQCARWTVDSCEFT